MVTHSEIFFLMHTHTSYNISDYAGSDSKQFLICSVFPSCCCTNCKYNLSVLHNFIWFSGKAKKSGIHSTRLQVDFFCQQRYRSHVIHNVCSYCYLTPDISFRNHSTFKVKKNVLVQYYPFATLHSSLYSIHGKTRQNLLVKSKYV